MTNMSEIYYYKRGDSNLYRESVLGKKYLQWAYQDANQSIMKKIPFHHPLCSRLLGYYFDSSLSQRNIQQAIDELNIDTSEFRDAVDSFSNFNAFFTRHLILEQCRPFDDIPTVLISPTDGRILLYPRLEKDTVFMAKRQSFTIDTLLDQDASVFYQGSAVISRLCPADYHRFHFPCNGRMLESRIISGSYHSVNPIALALGLNIFCENKRQYWIFENPIFGKVVMVEIGAFGVGSIVITHPYVNFKKMDEKGFFKFGGSTIILLFQKNRVNFDDDLVRNTEAGYETLVRVGERIGCAKNI